MYVSILDVNECWDETMEGLIGMKKSESLMKICRLMVMMKEGGN